MNVSPDHDRLTAAQIKSALRDLPQIQRLLEHSVAGLLCETFGRDAVTRALRQVLDGHRRQIRAATAGSAPDTPAILSAAEDLLSQRAKPVLRRVINATGIVLHTNLGRAPLAAEAIRAVADAAAGYTDLETDLATGRRGSRTGSVEPLIRDLTGAESALVVNNGAAAILLALSALSGGGDVIVSRGELVEIGGGFRIPDVIRQGGANLVEVGATNKTRAQDYRDAIDADTRILLKVHQSNFRMSGFTEDTPISELAVIARDNGLTLVVDLGSGLLHPTGKLTEPTVREALDQGADLVTFSGDKLLGGPQGGLIAGCAAAVDPLRRHPLLRAVRLDKMSLAAIAATLILHRDRPERIPVLRMLLQQPNELQIRAERLCALAGIGRVEPTEGFAGGGTLPEQRIESRAVVLQPAMGADPAAAVLRANTPSVMGRIAGARLYLDMLAVADDEVPALAEAVGALA